jgi:hypothetical protein
VRIEEIEEAPSNSRGE